MRAVVAVACAAVLLALPTRALAQHEDWPEPVHDDQLFWKLMFDQLEYSSVNGPNDFVWELEGWIGDDYTRGWLKSEGERADGEAEIEIQALYSRLISPFWELQGGVRYDRKVGVGPDLSRAHLVVGLQGLAPYWWETEPALFISEDGDVSARITASYDALLTQRLILQPEIEINVAAQSVEEWGVGSGFNDLSLDLRLRYELRREIAPYLGVGWSQKFGRTADLARDQGEAVATRALLFGIRAWF